MAKVICIAGESGTGKTTAMKGLNPETTLYIDCDKKGLNWKGWKEQYSNEKANYVKTDYPRTVLTALKKVNENINKTIKFETIVVDTLNGIMVADEMRRCQEKGYDKWQDMAQSIYGIVDYALSMRDELTVIFVAHTQTERDDTGYTFTRIKTSGRKLDKITLESKFTTVLISKCVNGNYFFETKANNSTAKTPLGAFQELEIENDITKVIEALKDY